VGGMTVSFSSTGEPRKSKRPSHESHTTAESRAVILIISLPPFSNFERGRERDRERERERESTKIGVLLFICVAASHCCWELANRNLFLSRREQDENRNFTRKAMEEGGRTHRCRDPCR
jgi:hypothetical protein